MYDYMRGLRLQVALVHLDLRDSHFLCFVLFLIISGLSFIVLSHLYAISMLCLRCIGYFVVLYSCSSNMQGVS